MNGISFILRSRNEAENLTSSLKSLTGLKIPFEVNIILHLTTDSSRKVIENFKTVLPINIYEYNKEVSRAGYETFVTPEDHKNSLVTFYKFCFNTGKYSWKFKWDADFFATRELIDFLNSMDLSDNRKVKYRIPVVLGETGIQNEEIYLSNCLIDFKKYLFWEVPVYSSNSLEINLRDVCKINSISYKVIKSYWNEAPWFIGRDEQLENSYKNLVKEWGSEPIGMARASNPEANKYISLASNIQSSIN